MICRHCWTMSAQGAGAVHHDDRESGHGAAEAAFDDVTGGVYTSAGGDERTANTPDNPWPVRTVNTKIADWVHKLGQIWVEGQITQISRRPRSRVAFITLRDPAADMSVQVTCNLDLLDRAPVPLTEGSRVVMLGRPTFYTGRATLSLRVSDIRPVGIGELLARIERLRQLLAAEGLFDPRLKQPLPFLPKVGPISGRASAAQRDVVAVATARWPSVRFEIRDATAGSGGGTEHPAAAGRPRRRRARRGHRHRPRRRQRRGPAAVLRRDAAAGGVRVPHAGDQRDRPRTRQPAPRPCGRCACCHPYRRRQTRRTRRAGRADRDRRSTQTQRPRPAQLGAFGRRTGWWGCAPGPSSPDH